MTFKEKKAKAKELLANGELAQAKVLIKELKEEAETKAELEATLKEIGAKPAKEEQPKEDEPKDEPKDEEPKKEDEPKDEPKEEEPKKETKSDNENDKDTSQTKGDEPAPEGGEQRSMKKIIDNEVLTPEQEETRDFMKYLKSKGEVRAEGMKSTDADVLIPKDIVTIAKETPETVVDLRKFVNVRNVTTATGKYPVLQNNTAKLATVAELEANPQLANPTFRTVEWSVETARGFIPISEEALQDSDDNLAGIVARHISRQGLNTSNFAIAGELKKARAVTVKNLDDIKKIKNVDFEPAYNLSLIVTQSFYQVLDTLKDEKGNFMLQMDIKAPSGKQLFGIPISVLKDEMLGVAGAKVGFIGDAELFMSYLDRASMTVRWQDHNIYGQLLAIAMRYGVVIDDPEAGRFITWDDSPSA